MEPMYEWIDENFPDINEEDDPEEWEEAMCAFHAYCENQERLEQERHWQEEFDYYVSLPLNEPYSRLRGDIRELKAMITHMDDPGFTPTFAKMIYAHAVTVLEVYLQSITKALILSSDQYLRNTISNVEPFCREKFKLSEISLEEDGIKKFVLGKLSDNLFHNIPKSLAVIGGVINKQLIQQMDISDIENVTSIRHDIVHRNGQNKDGENIDISMDSTLRALVVVETFTEQLRGQLPDPEMFVATG